ncbi:MAG: GrpB family protein [Acidimicrobiales bacterium]
MEIFRFDDEVSRPVTQFGSRFKLASLTDHQARISVVVMHLAPDGLVGEHEAASRQFLAVVAGSGWASGADGRRRPLRAGYAALFERGERHSAGSAAGLTAICIEGEFEPTSSVVTTTIVVNDYDPAWAQWFEQVKAVVWPEVADVALRLEHVGSTSVPGLPAKPIIDADIVVASEDDIIHVIERLAGIGYHWRGDLGVPGRQAFTASGDSPLPVHHLYAVVENNRAHIDHWLLRETLVEDPDVANAYGELKRQNARLADRDMDFYVAAKAAFVADVLAAAREARRLPAEEYWRPDLDRAGED